VVMLEPVSAWGVRRIQTSHEACVIASPPNMPMTMAANTIVNLIRCDMGYVSFPLNENK
jgi:hypothetical protein